MSVIVMVNEKFREGVPPWEVRISNIHYVYVWLEGNLAAWWLEHWTGEWKVQVHEAVICSSTRYANYKVTVTVPLFIQKF